MKRKTNFAYVVWKEGKYYVAQCLNIDVSSFGNTKPRAIKNLEEALELYIEDKPGRIQEVKSPTIVFRQLQHA